MSLNETVSAERIQIAFFGRRNAGKSSVVNALVAQKISLVSDVAGTTTDPVRKSMELLPLGPVTVIDTAGYDDEGELGLMRVEKTYAELDRADIALLLADSTENGGELSDADKAFLYRLKEKKLPYIIVHTKADLLSSTPAEGDGEIWVSAETGEGIDGLKEKIAALGRKWKAKRSERVIVSDLIERGDTVVLVTPIDESAPRGRLILPQQMTIRDILDKGAAAVVCQPEELSSVLDSLKKPPRIVITDSQAFGKVAKNVPSEIPLTSFSILFARYKGTLCEEVAGAALLSELGDGDKVLIAEGCTHHRQCGDIGTVKIPKMIEKFSSHKPQYTFTSGGEFPGDVSEYKLVIHCGACMLTETVMRERMAVAHRSSVPVVNYGVALAHMNGILARSVEIFGGMSAILSGKGAGC